MPRATRSELLYGRNAVIEALRGRRTHQKLYVADGAERQDRIGTLLVDAQQSGVPIVRLRVNEIERLAGTVNHQGVVLESSAYPYASLQDILRDEERRPIVILDHIQDPQNLGTLFRTAEAAGIAGIIIPDRRAASVTPAVVNASSGAVEHLLVNHAVNLARALDECKLAGYWITALESSPAATSLFAADVPEPAALVIGSEGKGIGTSLIAKCDLIVDLPMNGQIESLNAAVAGSITLYELLRRRISSTT
ncbi:MAG TPA: 23S rRNA (guanosine(2251)-2'-O)-methyltransferase RlmB [Nitrolancea sp.]|jgi:23S rRNA (guanosine2251-2'-O)-methyltransferase|nr:23S rRNA (guanosine(2251)-2'-O)-methyltransferase RlmB [Nitrolancea sp.]